MSLAMLAVHHCKIYNTQTVDDLDMLKVEQGNICNISIMITSTQELNNVYTMFGK